MTATGKLARAAVWGTLVAVLSIGCQPLTMLAFMLHKDDKLPAAAPLKPPADSKKDEVTVAIFCQHAPGGLVRPDFYGADRQLAQQMTAKFAEIAKAHGNKDVIKTVPVAQVEKYKAANPNWNKGVTSMAEVGKKLGADYVLDITLSHMQLYQPNSVNALYDGRAEVSIDVYDSSDTTAQPKHLEYGFAYPKSGFARDASMIPASRFKQQYMENLAYELVLQHVDHKPSIGIASEDPR